MQIKISEKLKQKILENFSNSAKILGVNGEHLFYKVFSPDRVFPYFMDNVFRSILVGKFGNENVKKLVYLDLGAGYGLNLISGLLSGFNCYGIEPSPNSFSGTFALALELMKEQGIDNPEKKLFKCSAENMSDLPDNFVDVIYSYQVLEHVHSISDTLREVKRVLKTNGIAYFTMPNYNSFYEGHYETFWIPYLLKIKILAKTYLRLIRRNPNYVEELNFTTPRLVYKIARRFFEDEEIYIAPWGWGGVNYPFFKFFGEISYAVGMIFFIHKLRKHNKDEAIIINLENTLMSSSRYRKIYRFLTRILENKLLSYTFEKLYLFTLFPFISDFRLIILSNKGRINMKNLKKPSQNHPNRGIVNFLAYDYGDFFLIKCQNYYKGTLVDLGCGEAPYKDFFLQFVDKYIGVDWSSSFHNIKADVISNLNEKIELPNESADVAVALSVMEHLYNPLKFLEKTNRILKKNGIFIISVPFNWWVHEAPHDYFRYTPYGLQFLLTKTGFKILEFYPVGGFFSMWLLKLNYFIERSIRPKLQKLGLGNTINEILEHLYNFNQKLAPILDKLDDNWILDAPGYWVVAQKK